MKGVSSVADADHSVEWQVNLTHVLLLVLAIYVAYKTDILEGIASSDGDQIDGADIAVEEPAQPG